MSAVIFAVSKNPRPGINLVVEGYPEQSLEIFGDMVSNGTRGLYISEERQPLHHVKPSDTRVRYLWFSKMGLSPGDEASVVVAELGRRIRYLIEESDCCVVMVDAIPRLLRKGNLASLGTLFETVSDYSEKRGVPIIIPVALTAQARTPEDCSAAFPNAKPTNLAKNRDEAKEMAASDDPQHAGSNQSSAISFQLCGFCGGALYRSKWAMPCVWRQWRLGWLETCQPPAMPLNLCEHLWPHLNPYASTCTSSTTWLTPGA